MQPDPKILELLVKTIVNIFHPLRIILFGSAARNELNQDSDLDILVVMPEGTHRLRTAQDIYQALAEISNPIDILVATPSDLTLHRNNVGLIYRQVLQEGRDLYVTG